jgi:hypothetical protein
MSQYLDARSRKTELRYKARRFCPITTSDVAISEWSVPFASADHTHRIKAEKQTEQKSRLSERLENLSA